MTLPCDRSYLAYLLTYLPTGCVTMSLGLTPRHRRSLGGTLPWRRRRMRSVKLADAAARIS
eukprot:6193088-Pleurochrysis_carterae.AAC.1